MNLIHWIKIVSITNVQSITAKNQGLKLICGSDLTTTIFLVPLLYAGLHLRLQYIKLIQKLILYFSGPWKNIKTRSLMLGNRKRKQPTSSQCCSARDGYFFSLGAYWTVLNTWQAFCQDVTTTVNICTILPSSLSGAQPNTVLCFTSSNEMA